MADQSLFNTSGIPLRLGMAAVNRRDRMECRSPHTSTLDTADPFTPKPMRSRICEREGGCGHCDGTGWIGDAVCPACNGTGG